MNVNITNGEVCASAVDLTISGFVPIMLERRYRSSLSHRGSFGHGWTCPFDIELELVRDEVSMILRDQEGQERVLPITVVPATFWPTTEMIPCVVRAPDEKYVLFLDASRRVVLTSVAAGRLRPARVEDRDGNGVNYRYDGARLVQIHDDMGREVSLEYSIEGLLAQVSLAWSSQEIERRIVALYAYDRNHDLVSYTDAEGGRWRLAYDQHLLVSIENPVGGVEYACYDERRRCIATWRSDGSRARLVDYDDIAHAVKVTDARGASWLYRLDEQQKILQRVSPMGEVQDNHYAADGSLVGTSGAGAAGIVAVRDSPTSMRVHHADGATHALFYTPEGHLDHMLDALGNAWMWERDDHGNIVGFRRPSGATSRYRFDRGFLAETTGPTGTTTRQHLDRRSGAIRIDDELGLIVRLRFDRFGLLASATDARERTVSIERDGAARISAVRDANGVSSRYGRDPMGRVISVEIDGVGGETYAYDAFDRVTRHTDALGRTTVVVLGAEDTIDAIVDPAGHRNEFTFDLLGRVIRQRFLDGRVETYRYDADGNITVMASDGARAVQHSYNEVGKVVAKDYSDGSRAEFAYDPQRRLVDAIQPGARVSAEYDEDGRLVRESQNDFAVTYSYDSAGLCTGWGLSDGSTVTFLHDQRGRLVSMEDSVCGSFHFAYDAIDQLSRIVYPGGTRLEYDYDASGTLRSQRLLRSEDGAMVARRDYGFDRLGRLTDVRWDGGFDRFEYDATNQLVAHGSAGGHTTFAYDPAGNSVFGEPGAIEYDKNGRLVGFGSTRLDYGPDGLPSAMTRGSRTCTFTYDGEERLTGCRLDDAEVGYRYDMAARLLAKRSGSEETTYGWVGPLPLVESTGDRPPRRYVYHPHLLLPLATAQDGVVTYSLPDWRAMVAATFRDGGEVESHEYTALGALRTTPKLEPALPFRLAGQLADPDSGMHLNRFRAYVPEVGRFLTPDPLGLLAGLNLYTYATNPILDADLSGLCDGETFYRTMSDAEAANVMKNCQLSNKPGEPNHDCFVTQDKAYAEKLKARHPQTYQQMVEICVSRGTARMMEDAPFAAASQSSWASAMFPAALGRAVAGANIIHLKFEQIASKTQKALNYGLRSGRIGVFNERIKSAKVLPNGPECNGPAA